MSFLDEVAKDIENRFSFHPPTSPQVGDAHSKVRSILGEAANAIFAIADTVAPGPSRELSLALTGLDDAMMYVNAHIARHQTAPVAPPAPPVNLGPPVADVGPTHVDAPPVPDVAAALDQTARVAPVAPVVVDAPPPLPFTFTGDPTTIDPAAWHLVGLTTSPGGLPLYSWAGPGPEPESAEWVLYTGPTAIAPLPAPLEVPAPVEVAPVEVPPAPVQGGITVIPPAAPPAPVEVAPPAPPVESAITPPFAPPGTPA